MSSQGNGQAELFKVDMSGQTKVALQQLHKQAWSAGNSKRFLAALAHIIQRLQQDPTHFGEPLFHLPALKLEVCQAVVPPLVVNFAIYPEQSLVFIRGFMLLS